MKKEELLNLAIVIATNAHKGQVDKQNQPYILHPLRVMTNAKLSTIDERIIAVLHDVLEDNKNIQEQDLISIFGEEDIRILKLLTRDENDSYNIYLDKVCTDKTAMKIKLCDIEDNLRDGCTDSLRKRYFDAMAKINNRMNK